MVEARRQWPLSLQERDSLGDRPYFRESWLHLGRQVVSLRHHAFRISARDDRPGELNSQMAPSCGRTPELCLIGAHPKRGSLELCPGGTAEHAKAREPIPQVPLLDSGPVHAA